MTTTTTAKACLSTVRHGEFHGRSQSDDDLLLANTAADATQDYVLAPAADATQNFVLAPGDRCQPELQTRLASHECMRPPADASQNYALAPASACSPRGRCQPKLRTRSWRAMPAISTCSPGGRFQPELNACVEARANCEYVLALVRHGST